MNRRNFLAYLAAVPVLGLLVPRSEAVNGGSYKGFPRIWVVDATGKSSEVPSILVDDPMRFPYHFEQQAILANGTKTMGFIVPCIAVSRDGKTIVVYCQDSEHVHQIYEQFFSYYGGLPCYRNHPDRPVINDLWSSDFDDGTPRPCRYKFKITLKDRK